MSIHLDFADWCLFGKKVLEAGEKWISSIELVNYVEENISFFAQVILKVSVKTIAKSSSSRNSNQIQKIHISWMKNALNLI